MTASLPTSDRLKAAIRTVPDWPQPGVRFRDLGPLLADPALFAAVVDGLADAVGPARPDALVVLDARGFLYGAALALRLGCPLVPARKAGKLPPPTEAETYALEYGTATIELAHGSIGPGQRVVLVDDLLATGGTLLAAASLVRRLGAEPVRAVVVVDLPELGGGERLGVAGVPVSALCAFRLAE